LRTSPSNRFWRLGGIFLVSFVLVLVAAARFRSSGRARGPVVIFLVDTLRPDRMSAYSAARETSPAASELSREGVTFENAYSVSTWTRPSVATLLTSLLPEETSTLNRYGRLDQAVTYLPDLFRRAGWTTAGFVGNGNIFDPRLGFERGFQRFRAAAIQDDGWKRPAREMVDPAIRFIQNQRSPKFFLFVLVVDPHLPYLPDPGTDTLFTEPTPPSSARDGLLLGYDRTIRQADDQFRRLADALRARGWWDDALVFYTADHGEEFYEHGEQGHGRTIYEEQVRVPLIVKFPGGRSAGQRRSDLASLADVTPTIAELAGLPPSERWMGASLRSRPRAERTLYFTEDLDDVRIYGARIGKRKLVVSLYPEFQQTLFELDRDPGEKEGRRVECGQTPSGPDGELYSAFREMHARTLAAVPSVSIDRLDGRAWTIDLAVNLKAFPKPFVSAETYCAFASTLRGNGGKIQRALRQSEPFHLRLAADDEGHLPDIRLQVTSPDGRSAVAPGESDAPFRITKTAANFVTGPTSDELLKHLRSLGYLGGGEH
jgi:Sulfatase